MTFKLHIAIVALLILFVGNRVNAQIKTDELVQLQSQHARTVYVYFLDSYLCLSTEQADSIEQLFAENWDNTFNAPATYLVYNGISVAENCFKNLDEAKLKEILSEKQYESFEALPTLTIDLSTQLNWMGALEDEVADDEDPILPVLRSVSAREIERLTELLSLDKKQLSKLSIAAKGACREIGRRRTDLKEKHGGDLASLLQKQANLGTLMEGPLFQLTKSSVWTKSIENTLDTQQLEKHLADQTIRYNRSKNAATFTIILGYEDSTAPFNQDEYEGFSKLVKDYLSDEFEQDAAKPITSVYFESFSTVLKIKDEELKSCLSDKSFKSVKDTLEKARERLERFTEENEDADDE